MSIKLPHYVIFREVHHDLKHVTYRGVRESDQTHVLIKTLVAPHPHIEDVARLKNEYELLSKLSLKPVIKSLGLEFYQGAYYLILDDPALPSLERMIHLNQVDLVEKLRIAIQLVKALGEIHSQEVIHKDVQPQNILINPKTLEVKLTGFTYATRIPKQRFSIKNPILLEGSLPYISPEQTGRMNREVDYRSDFYSLGVTLYQLFTHQLPFNTLDPMELVHSHIAKTPPTPHQIDSNIPIPVSDIIMKLMAKKAEERYSNSFSLLQDLEYCLNEYQAHGEVESFALGQRDVARKLQISQKIYGREREVKVLLDIFDEVCTGTTQMMLISGYAGIGKTSLVNEIRKPVLEKNGFFISGKFDQFKKGIPYHAFIESFQDLIQQILTENDEVIAKWRERLKEALGSHAPVIFELIPELQYIFGERLPSQEFDTQETQNRFNFFFQKFISLYATHETPLVIHLDDLQWIDTASLQLIEVILTRLKTRGLFLIGSYRSNEVSSLHPLMTTIQRIRKNRGAVTEIEIPPLNLKNVEELLMDSLHSNEAAIKDLAKLITEKTQGNPFFINQLLIFLYEEKFLSLDSKSSQWTWDTEKIASLNVSDNVVDLLILKLQKCSLETQKILKIAACVGTHFDIRLVARIAEKPLPEIMNSLMEAIHDGFILPSEDALNYLWSDPKELNEAMLYQSPSQAFRFQHDKVLQAAYIMADLQERTQYHLKIGHILQQKFTGHHLEEHIFEIVTQLNQAITLITDPKEKRTLAKMNFMAGQRAMRSVAYGTALGFLRTGLSLLPDNKWQSEYQLTFDIHLAAAECEYLLLNYEEASHLFDRIMQYAKTVREKVLIDTLKVKLNVSSIQYEEALKFGRNALNLMGISLPSRMLKIHVLKEFLLLKARLLVTDMDTIRELPVITKREELDILNLMAFLVTPAYLTSKELFALVVLKGLNFTLKHGNSEVSAYLYACYGIMVNALFEDFKNAYAFGQLALELNRRFEDQKWVAPTKSFVGTFLDATQNHLKHSVSLLQSGYEMSTSIGDFNTAVFCLGMMTVDKYLIGENIDELMDQILASIEYCVKVKSHNRGFIFMALRQTIYALKGKTYSIGSLSSEGFEEERYFKELIENNFVITLYFAYTFKMQICFLFKAYDLLEEVGFKADNLTHVALGQPMRLENDFYYALGLCAVYLNKDLSMQKQYRKKIKEILKRLQTWSKAVPANNLHKYLLVKAEWARVNGYSSEAIEAYDRAITTARENGYIHVEGIASELFGKFYLSQNKTHLAKQYFQDAHYAYYRWGASGKVLALEKLFPSYFPLNTRSTKKSRTEPGFLLPLSLDQMAVIKAIHSISSEIVLEKLITHLMNIVIETAGAQKAALIQEKEGNWFVAATITTEKGNKPAIKSIPLKDKKNELSTSIIHFVIRTKEPVVLDDASNNGLFMADAYIVENRPQSILCLPLLHQGKVIGALYLENNLTTKAFTPERIEILKLLTTQIATSLDNSLLYLQQAKLTEELKITNEKLEDYSHNLEKRVYERTRELNEKNQQLQETLNQIKDMQKKLIQQEKLVSLGVVTKGIATEMRTPLNYIYNFADLSKELVKELKMAIPDTSQSEALRLIDLNLQKIYSHSKKADEVLTSMLQGSREVEAIKEPTDINKLIREYADLVYQSYYKKDPFFSLTIETNYDPLVGKLNVYPQNLGRVFYNIIDNACYATDLKKKELKEDYSPILSITTKNEFNRIIIKVKDNGIGMPKEVQANAFAPFFTTKPAGKSAGMGLTTSQDIIVQEHGGTIDIASVPGQFTEVTISLPKAVLVE
ncbi:MAG: trifunctional serine/threonine-protein kinase/ATP-binding protein/sensor histidine kinase [Parachlamydiaceae bacterium]